MRKKFMLFVALPLSFLLLVVYLFIDQWVESALESAGEGVVGARVEIDNLRVTLSPIGVEFSHLQVANPKNPWKNIFETGRVSFALDFGQLLRGKYIVEAIAVNDLILGTKRATDGSLLKKPAEQSSPSSLIQEATATVTGKVAQAPVFDLDKLKKEFKIDSLLNVHNLKTLQHIDTLKLRVQQANQEWQSILADVDKSKQRLAEIEASIKAINLNELKTIQSISSAVTNANDAYKNINELNESFKVRRLSVTNQINSLSASVTTLDDLAREDYERVKGLARLPNLSVRGIANMLVGRMILSEVEYYLGWVEYARNTVPKYIPEPEYEKPKRFEGQNIHFPSERSYPKLWVKKIIISGGTDKKQDPEYFYARGEVKNITNDQRLTGQPLTISLAGTKGGDVSLTLDAMFDRRKELPVDNYRTAVTGIRVSDFELGRSDFLPAKITQSTATAGIEVTVPGNQFDSRLKLAFDNITMAFDRPTRNDVERIVRQVFESVTGFNVGLRLWNTGGSFDLAFTTDLDDQIAARTKKVIGDEIARLQNEIRSKVNQKIAEKRTGVERLFNQKKEEALSRLKSYENLINEKIAFVQNKKKELEARVEGEKKKQTETAKKKLEDALKGLIKKQ